MIRKLSTDFKPIFAIVMNFQKILIKLIALFSVIRGYNLIILMLAQYLASLFIFASDQHHLSILKNYSINGIILSSLLCVAAGYIINNFYDLEKDFIKQPMQAYLHRQVSQSFKLTTYIVLNASALIVASFVSWRVVVFFLIYQFLVWFYSHKINQFALIKNLYLVVLRVIPFFALMLYFDNYSATIFQHALYLMVLLLMTDLIKNLSSQKADLIYHYNSFPIKYGERATKIFLSALILFNCLLGFYMINSPNIGSMKYFFWGANTFFILNGIIVWKLHTEQQYKLLHYFFKLMIVIGVFSIVFIEINPLTLQNIALLHLKKAV